MKRRELLAGALGATLARYVHAEKSSEGQELIGQTAPALQLRRWLHSPPIDMADLRGKVVLLRWWTQGCPFCEATAPALPKLQAEYGSRGLVVLGIYHPKPPGDWTALKRWWLQRDRAFTSVSFVVDRSGVIRYVHPGGEFHEGNQGGMPTHDACRRDYRAIDAEIAMLLNRT